MASNNRYCEYLDIDARYVSCIDEAAIRKGVPWENTYPHSAFIRMLTEMERTLARQNNSKTLWIEGAYGTGKSQCVYALRKILEAPEPELRAYWDRYEPLKKKIDLLNKLIGHRNKGVVVAHRYASGWIRSPRDLFTGIQESVKSALVSRKGAYLGENTLKESIIAWLEDSDHKLMFDSLLKNPDKDWCALFAQSTSDAVLEDIRKCGDVKMLVSLVNNIFRLADKEGITALNINSDRLIAWLTDIIDRNNIQLVFIWDEFSDYFKNNRESLSEFQKVVSLCQEKPFYFIVVTHETQQMYVADSDRGNQSKVSDRFVSIPITLPDNIAFELIGHAFNVKSDENVKAQWDTIAGDLNGRLVGSRAKVMEVAKIDDHNVMKKIMPLHPMAVLLLKNIASAFQSNQRSMFDFIKSKNEDDKDVEAFQWFIENTGPHSDHPLLTVDMLWNFFYEKGKDRLSSDVRLILDTFPQQRNLRDDHKAVLKAILIMQAIDQRLGGAIDLFKATERNLAYVFEGISSGYGLDVSCKNIAKRLKDEGILTVRPISGGEYAYETAVLAGDQTKIDNLKKEIRQNSATSKLVSEGELSTVLSLPPALCLRFEAESGTGKITPVTKDDFTRNINTLRDKATDTGWKFHAVIAFAKDEAEAADFRKVIKVVVADVQYKNIIFIDTLSTPLGLEAFERYVDFSAMAMYYSGSNNREAVESGDKAKRILDQDWKNRIFNGQIVVYRYAEPEGEKLGNAQGVASVLQTIVTKRFPLVFDFAKKLTEGQLKLTQANSSARAGIYQKPTTGVIKDIEKYVLPTVWGVDRYWENPSLASLSISKIKVEVDKRIEVALARDGEGGEGRISIGNIYDFLEEKYGFAPCNVSAFLTGFLLKEYSGESYRYCDSEGALIQMTQDKLAEMIGNYIGKSPKPTYIVKITPDEMAFYNFTEKAWGINENTCSSPGQAAKAVEAKMHGLQLPIWCLEEVDNDGVFDVVKKYIELVQADGDKAYNKALDIGRIASAKPQLVGSLSALLTRENCQKGMREYLKSFEGGKLMELAKAIGAEATVLNDISRQFDGVEYSCKWNKEIGEDKIRELLTEYGIAKESNAILNASAHSKMEAFKQWCARLSRIGISCETLRAKHPASANLFNTLFKICKEDNILPEQLKVFHSDLMVHDAKIKELLNDGRRIFAEIYRPYLENMSDDDIAGIMSALPQSMFELSETECNAKVKGAAEEFRKNQLRSQLFRMWKDKTGTRNPNDWSDRYKTPILCCVPGDEFKDAKKTFETLNRSYATDAEIKEALTFLGTTTVFGILSDASKRNAAFMREIVGEYRVLLPDIDRVREELERFAIDVYDWRDNPDVKSKVKQLAEAEYNAGGSDRALKKIDEMDNAELKQYLKRLVKESIAVGVEILTDKGGKQNAN